MRRPYASEQRSSTHCEACGIRPSRRITERDADGLFACPACVRRAEWAALDRGRLPCILLPLDKSA